MGTNKDLTLKQAKFAEVYVLTDNASEAYRQAYDCSRMSPAVINKEACLLLQNRKVSVRVRELRKPMIREAVVSIEERKKLLSKAIRKGLEDKDPTVKDGLKAIDVLNQMEGLYITKTEHGQHQQVRIILTTVTRESLEEAQRKTVEGELVEGSED